VIARTPRQQRLAEALAARARLDERIRVLMGTPWSPPATVAPLPDWQVAAHLAAAELDDLALTHDRHIRHRLVALDQHRRTA